MVLAQHTNTNGYIIYKNYNSIFSFETSNGFTTNPPTQIVISLALILTILLWNLMQKKNHGEDKTLYGRKIGYEAFWKKLNLLKIYDKKLENLI